MLAALVLLSRENDSPDQRAFDPNFEPEVTEYRVSKCCPRTRSTTARSSWAKS